MGRNILKRKITPTDACSRCGEAESYTHMFFHCPFVRQVWKLAPTQHSLNVDIISDLQEGLKFGKSLLSLPPVGISEGPIFPWVFWALWSARNKKVFNAKETTPKEAMTSAVLNTKEWLNARMKEEKKKDHQPNDTM